MTEVAQMISTQGNGGLAIFMVSN